MKLQSRRAIAAVVACVLVPLLPVVRPAPAGANDALPVAVATFDSRISEIVVTPGAVWVSVPGADEVVELDATTLARGRDVTFDEPYGLDVFADGTIGVVSLAFAGFFEIDPTTAVLTERTSTETSIVGYVDLAEAPNGTLVLVPATTSPAHPLRHVTRGGTDLGVDGFAEPLPPWNIESDHGVVLLSGWASANFAPPRRGMYRLEVGSSVIIDATPDDVGTIAAPRFTIAPDGRTYGVTVPWSTESLHVIDTATFEHLGRIDSVDGMPVVLDGGARLVVVTRTEAVEYETETFTEVARHDVSACGIAGGVGDVAVIDGRTIVVSAGETVCRFTLPVAAAAAPTPVGPAASLAGHRGVRTWAIDLGTPIGDLAFHGDSIWASLPAQSRLVELASADLAEHQRPPIGPTPRGVAILPDATVVAALDGGTGYASLDPVSGDVSTRRVPLLDTAVSRVVAGLPDGSVLIGDSYRRGTPVRVFPSIPGADPDSLRVASAALGQVAVGAETTVIESGGTLLTLDHTVPAMPVIDTFVPIDPYYVDHLALSTDDAVVYAGSRWRAPIALRVDGLRRERTFPTAGIPVALSEHRVAFVARYRIDEFDTSTGLLVTRHHILGCDLDDWPTDAEVIGERTVVLAAGSQICRVELGAASERGVIALFEGDSPFRPPFAFGRADDRILFCDWNGNGVDEVVAVRPSTGTWYLGGQLGPGAAARQFRYGVPGPGDLPICGDWNGDGHDTPGIYRVATSEFHLRMRNTSGPANIVYRYGNAARGDRPIVGDFDNDGDDEPSVYRRSDNTWHITTRLGPGRADLVITYGSAALGDLPVVGDWDGNGTTTIGVWRNGEFLLSNSLANGGHAEAHAAGTRASDTPVVGRWRASGPTDVGVIRIPSTG